MHGTKIDKDILHFKNNYIFGLQNERS